MVPCLMVLAFLGLADAYARAERELREPPRIREWTHCCLCLVPVEVDASFALMFPGDNAHFPCAKCALAIVEVELLYRPSRITELRHDKDWGSEAPK